MSKVKLTYFDSRGRAELIRLTLKASKIEFEDVRVAKENWPSLKSTFPTGKLPVLEHEGKQLTQSMAISRAIARKNGLMGADDKDYYLIERAIGQISDVLEGLYRIIRAPENQREEVKTEFVTKSGKENLKALESFIRETGFFVGETVTLAELYFIVLTDYLPLFSTLYDEFPKLKELREKILKSNAEVDEWVKTRPVTQY